MHRLAAVAFVNSKPLLWGLDQRDDIALKLDVPSGLLGAIDRGAADVALLPTIDYQRRDDLLVIPAGGIGCDGPTLTVRLFSRRPIDQTTTLAVDSDSHTSVVLAQVILAKTYGIRPRVIPLAQAAGDDVRLLIGDKVICEEPDGYPHQLDLGQAWKDLTGLPFLFAVWVIRRGVDPGHLPQILEHAWHEGLRHVDEILERHARPRGWPDAIAREYLTRYLKFSVGPPQLEAMRRFHAYAAELELLDRPTRAIALVSPRPEA